MELISQKSLREIELMRKAGRIAAAARKLAGGLVRPGVTTLEIDSAVRKLIEQRGARPSFLHYNGFPASVCISINDAVIHGIPSAGRRLKEGDLVSIDVGAEYQGYHGDCAATFLCGEGSDLAKQLIGITEQSFWDGIAWARAGNRVSDISGAVQRTVEAAGFSVVRDYVGHGVGSRLHEPPEVPNFRAERPGARLFPGMTLAVEPMVNAGVAQVRVLPDGWTVLTADGSLSAHYENSILITEGAAEILTAEDD